MRKKYGGVKRSSNKSSAMSSLCSGWCAPVIIYLILSGISIYNTWTFDASKYPELSSLMNRDKSTVLFQQVVVTLLWTGLMYWLCSRCQSGWSWFILVAPMLISGLALVYAFYLLSNLKKLKDMENSKQLKEGFRSNTRWFYNCDSLLPNYRCPDQTCKKC